jgi:hypothetical protein
MATRKESTVVGALRHRSVRLEAASNTQTTCVVTQTANEGEGLGFRMMA